MSVKGIIGFRGMKPSGNELALPAGSLIEAINCVIPSRDELMPRRGQKLSTYIDNDPTNANANIAKELFQWGVHLFIHYSGNAGGKLALWKNWATAPAYAALGSFEEPDPTILRMKFAKLARSVFWTSSAGLYTIAAATDTARRAGLRAPAIMVGDGVPGYTGLTGNVSAVGSWLAVDRTLGYRAVIGRKDSNGRVVLSGPSGRVVVVNPKDLAVAIGGLVRNANVVSATVASHKARVGDRLSLTLTGGDVGNFNVANNVVTAVTPTVIQWAEVAANYVNVAAVTVTSGTKSVQIGVTGDLAVGDFVRIYRTDEGAGEAIDPGDECFLAYERVVTAAGLQTITDTTPSSFLSDPLSTNANTGEGPNRGFNERPPLMRDVCRWDSRLWGLETTDLHRLRLRLLGTGPPGDPNGLQSGDLLAVNTRVYSAAANFDLEYQCLPTENVDKTTYSIATFISNGGTRGFFGMQEHDGDTGLGEVIFEQYNLDSTMADGSSGAIGAIYAATSRASAWGDPLAATKPVTAAGTARTLGTTVTVQCVGHGFVQGQLVMLARAETGATDANFALGLKTVASVVDADHFTYAETGANVALGGGTPYYAYATTFKSDNNRQLLRFTKPGEPEYWPQPNFLDGFPDGAEGLRVKPLASGNGLLVALKDDDFFIVSGRFPYVVRRLDGTASLLAADSLQEHASQLYGLTTKGVSMIGDSGVGIVGSDVQDMTRFITTLMMTGGQSLSQIFGVSYDSDDQYLLLAPAENPLHPGNVSSSVIQALVLQSLLGQYTRWFIQRTCGLVWKGGDYLVMGDGVVNQLRVERKGYSYLDFVDEQKALTGSYAVQSATTMRYTLGTGDLTLVSTGDALEVPAGSGTYYRVTGTDNATYVDFTAQLAPASAAATLYAHFSTLHTWAADSRGTPGVESRWRQLQLHFQEHLFSALTLTYQGEKAANTGSVVVQDPGFAFGTAVKRLTTIRAKVHDNLERVALQRISMTLSEAFSYFRLLGYSGSAEPITEKTGQ